MFCSTCSAKRLREPNTLTVKVRIVKLDHLQQEIQEIREYDLEAGDKVGSSSDEKKVEPYNAVARGSPKEKEVKLKKNKKRKRAPPPKKNPQRDTSKKQLAENSRKECWSICTTSQGVCGKEEAVGDQTNSH